MNCSLYRGVQEKHPKLQAVVDRWLDGLGHRKGSYQPTSIPTRQEKVDSSEESCLARLAGTKAAGGVPAKKELR